MGCKNAKTGKIKNEKKALNKNKFLNLRIISLIIPKVERRGFEPPTS
jgi:hypothetical protein